MAHETIGSACDHFALSRHEANVSAQAETSPELDEGTEDAQGICDPKWGESSTGLLDKADHEKQVRRNAGQEPEQRIARDSDGQLDQTSSSRAFDDGLIARHREVFPLESATDRSG